MSYIIFFLVYFSKPTTDWTTHMIEPRLAIVWFAKENTIQIYLLNKFDNSVSKGELNLLLWEFSFDTHSVPRNVNEGLALLEKAKKDRFVFETETAFSGKRFSTENGLAQVETNIELKDRGSLKLFFISVRVSNENVAKLIGYTYGNGKKTLIFLTDETINAESVKKIMNLIKTLEKERRHKILLFVVFSISVVFVIILIAGGLYYCLKHKKKKPRSK